MSRLIFFLMSEAIFGNIDGDVMPTEVESLCMSCEKNGITRLLLTKIPHFKEVIIMAFECPHCGTKNNEIQSASVIAPQGQTQVLSVQNIRDLSRQVVKAESASILFKEIEFEIPPSSQKGSLSTIEGILGRSIEGLSQDQDSRMVLNFLILTIGGCSRDLRKGCNNHLQIRGI